MTSCMYVWFLYPLSRTKLITVPIDLTIQIMTKKNKRNISNIFTLFMFMCHKNWILILNPNTMYEHSWFYGLRSWFQDLSQLFIERSKLRLNPKILFSKMNYSISKIYHSMFGSRIETSCSHISISNGFYFLDTTEFVFIQKLKEKDEDKSINSWISFDELYRIQQWFHLTISNIRDHRYSHRIERKIL